MSTQIPKVYVPKSSAKEKIFRDGSVINVSFKADELIRFIKEHQNDKGYLNLKIEKRREVGQYGDTHSVVLNDWTPEQKPVAKGRY